MILFPLALMLSELHMIFPYFVKILHNKKRELILIYNYSNFNLNGNF